MPESIPVLGTAIVNGAHWLQRQVQSIDYAVDHYIVINNNGRGELTAELDAITQQPHEFVRHFHVVHLPGNIGCAGAWNLIIKSSMMCPYWMICGHDVAFHPGFLSKLAAAAHSDQVGMVHGASGDHGVGSWSLFTIRDWVIQEYGLFDENFYPAYAEDLDYVMRLAKRPIKKIILNEPYLHGDSTNDDYSGHGSQTWRSEPRLKGQIDWARQINETKYMTEKWGAAWRWIDPHWRPWNNNNNDLGTWRWNLGFCRQKHLGF